MTWTKVTAVLACGHEVWIGDTTAPLVGLTDDRLERVGWIERRQDGWYRAYKCPTCRRRRAVTSLRIAAKI